MTVETYVTIHDQDLVLSCEADGRFDPLSHTYLFVGPRPVERLPKGLKVVVCRDFEPNFERFPNFYDFTGWYVLAKHDLLTTRHVIMVQYDHRLIEPRAGEMCAEALSADPGMVAFVTADQTNWMLKVPGFESTFRRTALACGTDSAALEAAKPVSVWPTTQGTAWRSSYLELFMAWFTPAFGALENHQLAGHLAERMLHVYTMLTYPAQVLPGLFHHDSLDCHGTKDLFMGNLASYNEKNAWLQYQSS